MINLLYVLIAWIIAAKNDLTLCLIWVEDIIMRSSLTRPNVYVAFSFQNIAI